MALTINTKIINDADNYSLDAKQVKGGYGVVALIADLVGLPAATIIDGSLYFCQEDDQFYKYNGTIWEVAEFGGGNVDDVQVNSTSIVTNKIANLTGSNLPSHTLSKISDVTATAAEVNVLDGITATTQELNYTSGVTANIQTQLNSKQPNLPQTVNDKYLHTNASTGALEWSDLLVQHTAFGVINTNAVDTSYTYNHGLNTMDLVVQVTDSNKETILVDVDRTSANIVTIEFGSAPGVDTFNVYCIAQSATSIPSAEEVEY